jgi:hypothetical protein
MSAILAKDSLLPFEIIREPPADLNTSIEESDDDRTPQNFFKKIFHKKRTPNKKKKKLLIEPQEELRKNHSDNDLSDTPFQDAIKKQFNAFKKFTEEMFQNNKNEERKNTFREPRPSLSDDEIVDRKFKSSTFNRSNLRKPSAQVPQK